MEAPNPTRRRAPRISERLSPCEACSYPISQRHHILPVGEFGPNERTAQLCANCHELCHIVERAERGASRSRDIRTLAAVVAALGWEDRRVRFAYGMIERHMAAESEHIDRAEA